MSAYLVRPEQSPLCCEVCHYSRGVAWFDSRWVCDLCRALLDARLAVELVPWRNR